MTINEKRLVLDLITGLFAWVWLLALVVFFVFLVLALFASGSWWHVGIAFVTAYVSKAFARSYQQGSRELYESSRQAP